MFHGKAIFFSSTSEPKIPQVDVNLYMKKYPTFPKNHKIVQNVKTIAILLFQRFGSFYVCLKNTLSSRNLKTQAMLLFQRFGKSVHSGDKA